MSTKESSVFSSDNIAKRLQLRRDYFSGFCPEQLQTFKVFLSVRTASYLKSWHMKKRRKREKTERKMEEGREGEKEKNMERRKDKTFFFNLGKVKMH